MWCSHCGTELKEGSKFCTNCGNPVYEGPDDYVYQPGEYGPQPAPQENINPYAQQPARRVKAPSKYNAGHFIVFGGILLEILSFFVFPFVSVNFFITYNMTYYKVFTNFMDPDEGPGLMVTLCIFMLVILILNICKKCIPNIVIGVFNMIYVLAMSGLLIEDSSIVKLEFGFYGMILAVVIIFAGAIVACVLKAKARRAFYRAQQ